MSWTLRTATELVADLQAADISAAALTRAFLDRIEKHDTAIGAFLRIDPEAAVGAAETIDQRRAAGETIGRLAGLPVAVKDVLCSNGQITSCGSRMLEQFRPPYDATAVAALKQADAVLIGRTNMDEFAMGGSTENSAFGVTRNPWDPSRIPGGSSGGAAACVAAGMVPLSVGTDTGGSIRQPAALCGVTGMKPTYGRVSRYGLVAFASSLDQIGPLARTAEDAALLLEVLAGHDPRDSTSVGRPVPRFSETVTRPLENLRIGIVPEHFGEGLSDEVERAIREALAVYESLGATVREVALPHGHLAVATYYIIAPCEASSNLARFDGVHYGYRTDEQGLDQMDSPLVRLYRHSRSEAFGPEVKRRIMLGTHALSAGYYDAYYLKALKVRRLIRDDYTRAFSKVDLILGPVTPSPAYRLGEKQDDPLSMYLFDLYTLGANLAGIAGMSIPCGLSHGGLPIGLHLQAPPFEEERLLRAAQMYQQTTPWHAQRPPEPEKRDRSN